MKLRNLLESKDKKAEALAKYLKVDKVVKKGDLYYDNEDEYLVLTDREANDEAISYNVNLLDDIEFDFLFDNKKLKKELVAGSYSKSGKNNEVQQFVRFYDEDSQHVITELKKRKLLDYSEIAKDLVKLDGRETSLAAYDHKELKLGHGLFAYRIY